MPLQRYHRTNDQARESLVELSLPDFVTLAHNLGIRRHTDYGIVKLNTQRVHRTQTEAVDNQYRENARRVPTLTSCVVSNVQISSII